VTHRRITLLAAIAAVTFTAAACGDDDPDPVDAPPVTEMMTEDSMVDEMMTDDSMVDEMMTDDSMVDEMMEDTTP
jgi:hypothetical protein